MVVLSTGVALISFVATNQSNEIGFVPVTISGTTIVASSYTLSAMDTQCVYLSVDRIDSTHVMVVYSVAAKLRSMIVTLNGTILAYTVPIDALSAGFNNCLWMRVIDPARALVSYTNASSVVVYFMLMFNSFAGITTPIILTASYTSQPFGAMCVLNANSIFLGLTNSTSVGMGVIIQASSAFGKQLGISQNSTGTVMLKGISKGHAGLTVGATYYYDANGLISTANTGTLIGYAISSTEIFIENYIIN